MLLAVGQNLHCRHSYLALVSHLPRAATGLVIYAQIYRPKSSLIVTGHKCNCLCLSGALIACVCRSLPTTGDPTLMRAYMFAAADLIT